MTFGIGKRADAEIRKLDCAIEQAPYGILITDRKGDIEYANAMFTKISGYTLKEIVGKNPRILKSGRQDGDFYIGLWETICAGKSWQGELQNKRENGELYWERMTISPVKDVAGAVTHFVAMKEDVTKLKQAERELVQAGVYLDVMGDALVALTLDAKITKVNRAFRDLWGYTSKEVRGVSAWSLFPEAERTKLEAMMAENLKEPAVKKRLESAALRKDGTTIPVLLTGSVISDPRNGPTGYLGVFRDITQLKEAEEALRRSEQQFRQAQKMDAIGRLAGGVAHDFNNILTAILGNCAFLLQTHVKDVQMIEDVNAIKADAERAAQLTRQLLAFSRKQPHQPKVLDLNAVIGNMDKLLRRLVREDIELITLPRIGLGSVLADLAQVEQVIMNLVVNARDAMPDGGKLSVETANCELDEDYSCKHFESRPGPHVVLSVSDNGCGMNEETLSQIFEPFFTTKEQGKGTGLGLAAVYGIVKQSGGSIEVYSELGHGTTFKIYLPRVDESAEALRRPSVPARLDRGTETVLLAEDNDQVRRMAARALREQGYDVLEARDGMEVLQISETHTGCIHLLLTDIIMPKLKGPELAKRLRSYRPGLKVLFLSGYAEGSATHNGLLSGDIEFLAKPYTPEVLLQTVRRILDS
ncbi:MAG: PAS domain S-box protein [Elusimicrobiota bacterium]